ncbi:MAG: enoyl-CoA hydratase/isomerase family protein [Pseudomonadota bacterium]
MAAVIDDGATPLAASLAAPPVILAEVRSGIGLLTLNRPAALNALSLQMVQDMHRQLRAWADDGAVQAVVVRGAGEKAFCAGGDIRALYDSYRAGDGMYLQFFEEEYALDLYIAEYPKPYIALMDGYVMGGGMGISQNATVRIVTERTRLAMPEVGIGYFPDVGGSYFLPRLPGRLGLYLALTGVQIRAADALYAGLADLWVPAAQLPELVQRLQGLDWRGGGDIQAAVAALVADMQPAAAEPAPLAAVRAAIDRHFSLPDVAATMASLAAQAAEVAQGGAAKDSDPALATWAADTHALMARRSPLAMGVTRALLSRGASLPLAACLRMELALDRQWFARGDFMEGVRAVIVDKDQQPRWRPATVGEVDEALVQSFFAEAT